MMRRFCPVSPFVWLSLALLGGLQTADAAFERQVTGGRSAGMGSAIVTGSPGVWSASVHSALLVLVDRPSIECLIQPSPFGLSELGRAGIAAALPFGPGTVALSGMRLGGGLYQETEVALSCGIRVHRMLLLGARLRWCHLSIAHYGSASAVACDMSVAASPVEGLVLATMVQGLNRPVIGESGERLPFTIAVGISYRPASAMEIAVEWEHDVLHDPAVNGGVEYALADVVCLRIGMAGATRSWTCGIGLRYGGLLCDYGVMFHPILGPAHTISVGFQLE
jgi:hypothetical protein